CLSRKRLDLGLQSFAIPEHAGKVAKGLGKAAARLLLDGDDDGEEFHFRQRNAHHHLIEALDERNADALLLDELPEFAAERLGAFACDNSKTIVERQPGFHTADDDINRIRELVEEFILAPFCQAVE